MQRPGLQTREYFPYGSSPSPPLCRAFSLPRGDITDSPPPPSPIRFRSQSRPRFPFRQPSRPARRCSSCRRISTGQSRQHNSDDLLKDSAMMIVGLSAVAVLANTLSPSGKGDKKTREGDKDMRRRDKKDKKDKETRKSDGGDLDALRDRTLAREDQRGRERTRRNARDKNDAPKRSASKESAGQWGVLKSNSGRSARDVEERSRSAERRTRVSETDRLDGSRLTRRDDEAGEERRFRRHGRRAHPDDPVYIVEKAPRT